MDTLSPSDDLELTELAFKRLQCEQLSLQLAKQRSRPAWYHIPVQLVPLITALVSVAGFLWGVLLYTETQEKQAADREKQSLREQALAAREFMKPWLESQRQTYAEALSAASIVANADDSKERLAAEGAFWQLFHGHMILVETKKVSGGMVHFGRCLDGGEKCDQKEMHERTRALASAMAEFMAETAQMSYEDFVNNQFRYTPSRTYAPGP